MLIIVRSFLVTAHSKYILQSLLCAKDDFLDAIFSVYSSKFRTSEEKFN